MTTTEANINFSKSQFNHIFAKSKDSCHFIPYSEKKNVTYTLA
jgi:hypothetical protein